MTPLDSDQLAVIRRLLWRLDGAHDMEIHMAAHHVEGEQRARTRASKAYHKSAEAERLSEAVEIDAERGLVRELFPEAEAQA